MNKEIHVQKKNKSNKVNFNRITTVFSILVFNHCNQILWLFNIVG